MLKTGNLNIVKMKPLNVYIIDLLVHAWKTCKRYKACAKRFTEFFNMAKLVNLHLNP